MAKLLLTREAREVAIVIAPRGIEARIRAQFGAELGIFFFDHLDEFDRWRRLGRIENETIAADVVAALCEIGGESMVLPPIVQVAIERLKESRVVPEVEDLYSGISSQRTFYRWWAEVFPESPDRFLSRVRVHNARRLIEQGSLTPKQAAHRAGYLSVGQFRRSEARIRVSRDD